MDPTPRLISVSELRRDLARQIELARRTPGPVFITQYGYITAVLLAPQRYEDLRDAAHTQNDGAARPRDFEDRRIVSRLYGPADWETSRLTGEDDSQSPGSPPTVC